MPISESESEARGATKGKRRRNSSGRKGAQLKRHPNTMKTHQGAAAARLTQMAGVINSVEKLKLAKYDLSEKGIEKEILLEALIAECILNNPQLRIFKSSANAINILQFSNPQGDVFTFLNVMRAWSNKAATEESHTWCDKNQVTENVCRAIENYVEERFAQIRADNSKASVLRFASKQEETERLLHDIIIHEIQENICLHRGHPSLGYMSLQSFNNVYLDICSVAHYYKDYPIYILALTDPFESRLNNQTLCMVINEVQATETYNRLSLGYDLQHTVKQNSLSPIRRTCIGEMVVEQMKKSWSLKAHTVPCSLKAFVEALSPQSPVIFEDKGNGVVVYALPDSHRTIEQVVDKELDALKDILGKQVAEISYPIEKSSLRAVVQPGGSIREILYPDQFRCVGIIQTGESTITKEKVVLELKKFGEIESVMQYHGEQLALGKWGKVSFNNPADVEKAMQAKLSGSFLLEFAFDNDIEDLSMSDPTITIDQSKNVSVRICRRPCASGNVRVKVNGKRNYGKLLKTTLRVNNNLATVCASRDSSDLIISGCDPMVTEEDITKAICEAHEIHPTEVIIDRPRPFKTDKTELELFKYSLSRMIDKVTDVNKVNIKLIEPNPADIFLHAQLKFNTARIATSAVDQIKNKKIKGLPLEILDYSDDIHYVHLIIPNDILIALESDLTPVLNKLSRSQVKVKIQQNTTSSKMYTFSTSSPGSLLGVVEVLENFTTPIIYPLTQEKCKKITSSGSVFLSHLSCTTACCLRLDKRSYHIKIYGPKSKHAEAKEQLNRFFKENIVYHHFDFSHADAKENAMFDLAKNGLSDLKDVEILPIKSNCQDLFVRGKQESVEAVKDKYFTQKHLECCICYYPLAEHDAYILQTCDHPYCWECLFGLINDALESKNIPVNCTCSKPLCLWDIFSIASTLRADPRAVVSKAIDTFMGNRVQEWAYCHNANCSSVMRRTPGQPYWVCPICYARQCSKCGASYHQGSCEDHNNQIAFEKWLKADENRKVCKNCNMAIEKISGCNRVHCSFCHREICWVCLAHFPDATACYNHLNAEHGGY